MFRNKGEKWALGLHLGLAAAVPLVVWASETGDMWTRWMEVYEGLDPSVGAALRGLLYASGWTFGLLLVLAPLIGYRWALYDDDPIPADEPCARSGNTWLGHWFEFDSLPDRRLYVRDRAQAQAIRARAPRPLRTTGHTLEVQPPAFDPRPGQHNRIALRALGFTAVGTASPLLVGSVGYLIAFVWSGFNASALGTGLFVLGVAAFYVVMILGSYGLAYIVAQQFAWLLWNGFARPVLRQVEVTAGQVRVDGTSLALDDPALTVELDHTWFDARLTLTTSTQRLVLHGDHAQLHALQRWLSTRQATPEPDREQTLATLSALRGRAVQLP